MGWRHQTEKVDSVHMTGEAYKVGCLFFENMAHDLPPEHTSEALGGTVTMSRLLPDMEDEPWSKALGSKWADMKKSNVAIKMQMSSTRPETVNDENVRLEKACQTAYLALQFDLPPLLVPLPVLVFFMSINIL